MDIRRAFHHKIIDTGEARLLFVRWCADDEEELGTSLPHSYQSTVDFCTAQDYCASGSDEYLRQIEKRVTKWLGKQ